MDRLWILGTELSIGPLPWLPLWKLSSTNGVTPVSIQDGVYRITFASISALSPFSVELSPIAVAMPIVVQLTKHRKTS